MSKFIDYYVILGIEPTTDLETIRKAYRKCAKKYHPDVNKDIPEDAMKKVNEAYEILKDQQSCDEYFIKYMKFKSKQEKEKEEKRKAEEARQEEFRKQEEAKKQQEEQAKKKEKTKKSSLGHDIKEAYKQVRRHEKNNPFKRRHIEFDEYIREDYEDSKNKFTKGIKRGSFHVAAEFLYQLHKFSYIGKDTVPKYVIRNRKMIGAAIMIVVGVNMIGNKNETVQPEVEVPVQQEVQTMVQEDKLTYELIRKYEIVPGDTLYDLAQETGVSVEKIQEYNHLDTSRIIAGETLKIPYTVTKEDLDLYTTKESIGTDSVYDFAEKHNTTVGTILELNSDKLYEMDGNFVIMEDELKVPNFITKQEFNEQKSQKTLEKSR